MSVYSRTPPLFSTRDHTHTIGIESEVCMQRVMWVFWVIINGENTTKYAIYVIVLVGI